MSSRLKDKITILQNFILGISAKGEPDTNNVKINHLKSDRGLICTSKVFGDCRAIVNFKSTHNVATIRSLYSNAYKDLIFYNIVDGPDFHWAKVTLDLLKHVETPYVFFLTEDRMFHQTTRDEFNEVMEEVVKNDIGFMSITKLWKYSGSANPPAISSSRLPYLDNDNHIYTYHVKNSPYPCVSVDSIFRKDILEKCLQYVIDSDLKAGYTWNIPHTLEMHGNWLSKIDPELLCAVPKREITVSDDDPGHSLGTIDND